jgi:hypothetical protein
MLRLASFGYGRIGKVHAEANHSATSLGQPEPRTDVLVPD